LTGDDFMTFKEPDARKPGFFSWLWRLFTRPSPYYSLGALVIYGFAAGVVFWGGIHFAMELTNTETFCVSCHEHYEFNYKEYTASKHYSNESGVRAICTDCHVPEEWAYKVMRKVFVLNELYYHAIGSLSTREKFEAKRLTMAERVWQSMEGSDSRECRNCHHYDSMNFKYQDGVAVRQHSLAKERGVTCIVCHRGLVHHIPSGAPERVLLSE